MLTGWEEHCEHEANAFYDDHAERYAAERKDARREALIDLDDEHIPWVSEMRYQDHARDCVRSFLYAVTLMTAGSDHIPF